MGADAQRRFLAAVRRGERLAAAAKASGFALSAFYHRRRRDAEFDSAWDEAVADAAAAGVGKARRRPRFTARRRAAYLDHLATCCDTTASAAAAGVHKSAVYRRIGRDPDFERGHEAALKRGYERLEAEARRAREAAAARWRGYAFEPIGRPTRDFDRQMRLLTRYCRPGRRRGERRPRRALSFDESLAALEVKLSRLDIPPLGDSQ